MQRQLPRPQPVEQVEEELLDELAYLADKLAEESWDSKWVRSTWRLAVEKLPPGLLDRAWNEDLLTVRQYAVGRECRQLLGLEP